jgi:alpha-L-fucosidase
MISLDARIAEGIAAGPFTADWESLKGYRVPAWYEDGKFGIFIHWGVYSVPAFGSEWYPRNMYQQGSKEFEHHLRTYGPQSEFGYKEFIPRLTASRFDPAAWAALFRDAGARFVVPVAEHHDGFPMYDCSFSDWTAAKMGPRRDIIGDLAAAVRSAGLVFGVSSHRAENWFFYDGGRRFPSDVQDDRYRGLYGPAQPKPEDAHDPTTPQRPDDAFLADWLRRTCELVDTYRPQLIWFDWWIEHEAFRPLLPQFAAYYYNRASTWGDWDTNGPAINHKYESFPEGTAVFDIERGQLAGIRPMLWQNDTSISKNSWGYVEGQQYKSVDSLVDDLVDIVSKNGALLLNIGPRPDGTIPEEEQRVLREIGAWLRVNGEAIYGTRPWKRFGEGPTEVAEGAFTDTKRQAFTGQDIRITTRGDALYVIALDWPGERLVIRSLGTSAGLFDGEVAEVRLLGHDGPLRWTRDADGLTVTMPERRPCEHAYVLKVLSLGR